MVLELYNISFRGAVHPRFPQQNEMLNEVKLKASKNILPTLATDEYCGTSDDCYPLQDQEKMRIMLKSI